MGRTSIPVDAATKERLDRLKRPDETWDDFLRRVTGDASPVDIGAWSEADAERAKDRIRNSREQWPR